MTRYPDAAILETIARQLDEPRAMPERGQTVHPPIVTWHVFRQRDAALDYAGHILVEDHHILIAGRTEDSVGGLWWVGVQVTDLEAWGNRAAVKKTDGVDPANPGSPML